MRPIYETGADRRNEESVALEISRAWDCLAEKLPDLHCSDYALIYKGQLAGFMEIKCRNYSYERLDELGGLFISKQKIDAIMDLCRENSVFFVLAIKLTNNIYAMSALELPEFEVKVAGRRDRNDPKDIEKCYVIPMIFFEAVT